MSPSPWLQERVAYERAARHQRNAAYARRIVTRAVLGASAGAAVVIALQFLGVLPA
jgi:hypothetical protein